MDSGAVSGAVRAAAGGVAPLAGPALFYDEELDFGRHGASLAAVEMAFRPTLATRTG